MQCASSLKTAETAGLAGRPPDRSGGARRREPRGRNNAPTASSWPTPSSTTSMPPGASRRRASRGDRPIGIKPVRAAIERAARIEVAHLGRERIDIAASRYTAGSTRSDRTVTQSAAAKVAGDECRAVARPSAAALRARSHERARARCRCRRRTRSAIRAAARAGSRREPVPRSAMRSAASRGPSHRSRRAPLRRRFRSPAAAPASPA